MNFSTKQWSSILCYLLVSVLFIGQSHSQNTRTTTNDDDFGLVAFNDDSFLKKSNTTFLKNESAKKSKEAENSPPPNPNQLLIDVNVNNTSPSANDVMTYKFRYRYASTTENGTNAQIQFTFPNAYEIVSPALIGGNISSISNNGNQYTISLESPANLGLPSGTLAAGASGLFEFQVQFKCGTNGLGGIPSAGSFVNLSQNPVFTVTGVSKTASAPSSVTVPTVSSCASNPPTSSGTGAFQKRVFNGAGQGRKILFGLNVPKNTTSVYTYTDIFPQGFKIHGGLENNTLSPGWTMEVQANGAWWDISNFQTVANFIGNVPIGAALKDQNGTNITGATRVRTTTPDGNAPPAIIDYAEGVTGIRVTGSGFHNDYYLRMYIMPDAPLGWTQNCLTTNNPAYPTDCVDLFVDNRGSLKSFCFFQNGSQGLGGTDLSNRTGVGVNVSTGYPNLYKDPMDVQGNIVIDMQTNHTPINAPTIDILLPLGFDFVEGTTKPNYWFANNVENSIINNPPSAFDPIFTRIPNHNGTGRVLLRWDFPNLVFPTNGPAGESPRLALVFSSRYMGTHPLPSSLAYFDVTIKAQSVFTDAEQGLPTQSITCTPAIGIPSSGGSVNSEKYVRGALDVQQSRYPMSGNTDLSGNATYEMFVYNHNFQGLKQIDIADILPHIGDKDMLGTSSRGSGWSEELANAITVERFKIGTGLVDASSKIPSGVLYSNTYNACYLDGALPSGQVTANPSSANTGQSGGCTDFSSSVAAAGAKGFAFRWIDTAEPLEFGEYLKITVDVTQLNGEADKTNNEVAWNSFAYTAIEEDNDVLFSSEPLKVGVKMVDLSSYAAIGGKVWHDENGNGKQDGGEATFKDVTVALYNSSGNPITETVTLNGVTNTINVTTLTDSLGNYRFYGLQPNTTYAVRLENENNFVANGALSGFILTTPNASGLLDNEDSDATEGTLSGSPTTARPQISSVTSGSAGSTRIYNDFGFYKTASVGNYVWLDDDAEGDQDASESPVQGVQMTLKRENGTTVSNVSTNTSGLYFFENIQPGTYYIEATSGVPTGKIPTTKESFPSETGSDFNTNPSIRTDIFTLASGQARGDIDLGLKDQVNNPATICGTVWDDLDEDGVKAMNEPPQAFVTVNLLDANGFVINTVQTGDGGDYCFYNLAPNTAYRVAFVLPSVTAADYTVQGADMDANSTTGITGTYTPTNNQTINNVDCGFIGPFSIGNLVWLDANNNGIKDASESPYSNVDVYLMNSSGTAQLAQTKTDNQGRYVFKNLVEGTYRVEIELPIYAMSSTDIATSTNPNAADNDDNGIGTAFSGRVQSQAITLQQGGGSSSGANWSEADHYEFINGEADPASNPKAYYTVDFGLVAVPPPPPCTGPDSDSDGVLDACDADDDNDGILDVDEGFDCEPIGGTVFPPYNYQNCSNYTGGKLFTNIGTYNGQAIDLVVTNSGPGFFSCGNTGTLGCSSGDNGFTYNNAESSTTLTFTFYRSGTTTPVTINWALNLDDFDNPEGIDIPNSATYSYQLNPLNNTTITDFGSFTRFQSNNNTHDEIALYFYDITTLTMGFRNTEARDFCFNSSVGFTVPNGSCVAPERDTDNDGIPNSLDLDSDNDGCPDAIEGTANFTGTNLQNDRLTGGVGSNGVPTVANGGQGPGESYNAADFTACCTAGLDSDNDGISDFCDVDDDNDGILDIVEDPCGVGFFDDFGTGTTEVSTPYISSDYIFDATRADDGEYTIATSGRPGAGPNSDWSTEPDHTPDDTDGRMLVINASFTAGEFYRRSFVGFAPNSPITFSFWARNLLIPSLAKPLKPNITYKIEDASGKVLFTANTGDLQEVDGWQNFIGNFTTSETTVFFVLVNNSTGGVGNDLAIDDISFKQIGFCDHDGDGIINSLDLDSDNDGCSDALEGSDNISAANIVNDRIGGSIDSDGVPVLANGGQGLGASQNNAQTLGCNEICNDGQDNDGDGFIDCADSDCAPILSNVAVTQPTCANKTGGQIVITASSSSALEYSITNEPNWQSSNTFSNLGVGQYTIRVRNVSGCTVEYLSNPVIMDFGTCIEICNNGIDDDGDGFIDCDDPDCGNVGTSNTINNN